MFKTNLVRPPRSLGRCLARLAAAFAAALLPFTASAQRITIDGRLSPGQTLVGPNYAIGADLGKQVGGNLFQSFGQFGLVQGETATFSGPGTVTNIIGRVSGGTASSIDGTVRSTIAGANLYLINPAGFVFGPHASINVSGSFRASTADYLRMSDGTRFQATTPDGSTLSAAAPAAFGFLNATPGTITVNGSPLTVPSGQTLGLVAGPVSIAGATLKAPAGTIHVASVAGSGEVPVDPQNQAALTVASLGVLSITGGSLLDVSNSTGSGSVLLRAGPLTVETSNVTANNFGAANYGPIDIQADTLSLGGGQIASNAFGAGAAGPVSVTAGAVSIKGGGIISSSTFGIGSAAPVTISAGPLSILGGQIFSNTFGAGNTGRVIVAADSLSIANKGIIASITFGAGNGGQVNVSAANLSLTSGGEILSNTQAAGSAGTVSVNVSGLLTIDGTGASQNMPTGIFSQALFGRTGNAGQLSVTAGGLSVVNGGAISTSTFGTGNAGRVDVIATSLSITNNSVILSSTFSTGNAGQVNVATGDLSMGSSGEIASSTLGAGNAGSVWVNVSGGLSIDGTGFLPNTPTGIVSRALFGSTGNAGQVGVSAGTLSIVNGGLISSSTFGSGSAGTVSTTVTGPLFIDGAAGAGPTGIFSAAQAGSSGNAGTVNVAADSLRLLNGGQISTISTGAGRGGDITVDVAGVIQLNSGGLISAGNSSIGAGGTVQVVAQGGLTMSDAGTAISASAGATASGNAGSVFVNGPQIIISNGAQVASTMSGTAQGGSVTVSTPGALVLDGAEIAASAAGTQSIAGGSVEISAGTLTIRGGAQIDTSTAGIGSGGDITIRTASDITLSGTGPQIAARSTGSGAAGSITVASQNLTMADGASISTSAASADGGNIVLRVGNFMHLTRSQVTTSVASASGNGGNIRIDPIFLVLDRSQIIAQAVQGHGGNISIVANQFIPSSESVVSASSQLGISGSIEITGPRVDLNGSLVALAGDLRDAAAVLRDTCAGRGTRPRSSLTELGRGGIIQDPEAAVPSLYLAGRDLLPATPVSADVGQIGLGLWRATSETRSACR